MRTWRSNWMTLNLNFLLCKMQIKSAWDPSEDDMWSLSIKWPTQCLMTVLFPNSLYSCLLTSLFMGMWTPAKVAHQSVVAFMGEGRMRLVIWGCMGNQPALDRDNSSCTHWKQGKQTHLYWALLHISTFKPFICIFIHPRNQQGDWAKEDTIPWDSLTEWYLAATHRTGMKGGICSWWYGEHYGM